MDDKVKEFLKILHPEYDLLEENKKINFDREIKFITENIEEIAKNYHKNKELNEEKENDDNKLNNEFLENNESNNENKNAQNTQNNENNEQNEITERTEEIDVLNNREELNNIIEEIKVNKYFSLLHPEYETLDEEDKYYVYDDKILIRDCIGAIDAYYHDCKVPGSGAQEMEWTDQKIIEASLQLFNNQEKIFTPNDIEQFSSKVKYAEFKQAINTIKEISKEDNKGEDSKQEE